MMANSFESVESVKSVKSVESAKSVVRLNFRNMNGEIYFMMLEPAYIH